MNQAMKFRSKTAWYPAFVLAACLLRASAAHAEADTFGTGTGRSGALSVSAASTVVNTYAQLTADVAAGSRVLSLGAASGASTAFSPGEMVLVWQVAGLAQSDAASGDTAPINLGTVAGGAVGRYEFARIKTVDAGSITLTKDLLHPYAGGFTQVVSVPEYTSVSIAASASITAPAWDGSVGGVVAFLATGAVSNAGAVTVVGKGFRGGIATNAASPSGCTALDGIVTANGGARKGEGPVVGVFTTGTPVTLTNGYGNRASGGGGGNCHNAGGGGGGNFGPGGKGGATYSTNLPYGGNGGAALVYSLSDHLSFGGGGGAGEMNNDVGTSGGSGGGVIFVRAASASGGNYQADGVALAGTGSNDGQGGGGAGGTVLLALSGTLDCVGVSANGGKGGNVAASHGAGGGGGGGYIVTNSSGGTCVGSSTNGAGGSGGNVGTAGTTGTTVPEPPIVVVPCDFASGTCGGCTSNTDCATLTGVPFCRSADAKCVACLGDSDCGGGTPWCDIGAGVCKAKVANGSALPTDNGHSSPVLDGLCNGPAAVLTCSSGVCDPRDNKCGFDNAGPSACDAVNAGTVCRSGACSANGGVCVPVAGCAVDADCNTSSEWCNVSTLSCVQKSANAVSLPIDAAHTSPVLDGVCSSAAASLTCASGVCDARDNKCGFDIGTGSSCTGANAASVCRSGLCSTAGTCIAPASCAADGDCNGGWCNVAQSTCAGKTPNGEPMVADSGHSSPSLDGTCSGPAAILTCASGVCDAADNKCGLADGTMGCTAANAASVCRTGNCKASGVCGKDPVVVSDAGAPVDAGGGSTGGADAGAPRTDASVPASDAGGGGGSGGSGSDAGAANPSAPASDSSGGGCSTTNTSATLWPAGLVLAAFLLRRKRVNRAA